MQNTKNQQTVFELFGVHEQIEVKYTPIVLRAKKYFENFIGVDDSQLQGVTYKLYNFDANERSKVVAINLKDAIFNFSTDIYYAEDEDKTGRLHWTLSIMTLDGHFMSQLNNREELRDFLVTWTATQKSWN